AYDGGDCCPCTCEVGPTLSRPRGRRSWTLGTFCCVSLVGSFLPGGLGDCSFIGSLHSRGKVTHRGLGFVFATSYACIEISSRSLTTPRISREFDTSWVTTSHHTTVMLTASFRAEYAGMRGALAYEKAPA
ncbi:unnamed protein product, partial [Ectocarpus sp. 8 AP-2014]